MNVSRNETFNHENLSYRYNGRDFRLTDVYGNVVKQVVA